MQEITLIFKQWGQRFQPPDSLFMVILCILHFLISCLSQLYIVNETINIWIVLQIVVILLTPFLHKYSYAMVIRCSYVFVVFTGLAMLYIGPDHPWCLMLFLLTDKYKPIDAINLLKAFQFKSQKLHENLQTLYMSILVCYLWLNVCNKPTYDAINYEAMNQSYNYLRRSSIIAGPPQFNFWRSSIFFFALSQFQELIKCFWTSAI